MKPRCQSFWLPGSVSLFCLITTSPLQAQIVQDATLPNPSIVTPNNNTSVITGGTQAGTNLFHSFREFSVPTGESASFQQVDQGISNIISRVTGSSVSNIDGLIEVLQTNGTVGSANFFLINPKGIIFGPNAQLNIGGSFLASTASSLNFADGTQFSATDPQTTPLLTVSVPLGLQFGPQAGGIRVQGPGAVRDPYSGLLLNRETGLSVQPSETLALVGSGVALQGGILTTNGGRIQLGSVAGTGLVSLTPTDKGWALGYSGVSTFGDIQLSGAAAVDASGANGGDIQVRGRRVRLTNGSQIEASTLGAAPGGTLNVTASESVELIGTSVDSQFPSSLFALVYPGATGAGSNLNLETGRLILQNGAQIGAYTLGEGLAGTLAVTASESVEISGTSTDGFLISSLFAGVEEGATGAGGNLTIETRRLLVEDGAEVSTASFGSGKAGNLTVQATESVLVRGTDDFNFGSSLRATDGGNLTIETGRLLVRDGAQVFTSTFDQRNAGNLTVQNATEVELVGGTIQDVELIDGTIRYGVFISSSLFTTAEAGATGNGGNLSISAGKLIFREGAQLNSTTGRTHLNFILSTGVVY